MEFDLIDWISPEVIENADKFREAFVGATPFRHLEINGFFHDELAMEFINSLTNEQFFEKESDLFSFQQTNDLKHSNDEILYALSCFLKSEKFVMFMEKMTGLKLKKDVLDLHSTIYEDTDYLLCHDDELDDRKIAFLIYLNDFEEDEGGSLDLFSNIEGKPTKIVKRIIPKFNKFAFFEVSETSFHEVAEVLVDKQRIAIGGWLHA